MVYLGILRGQVWQGFACSYLPFSFNMLTHLKDQSLFNFQEVAIKQMRSNKSKEFFAELKILCKIHHINVVRNYISLLIDSKPCVKERLEYIH